MSLSYEPMTPLASDSELILLGKILTSIQTGGLGGGGTITSVNGDVGPAVTLVSSEIAESGSLYFTEARVRATPLTGYSPAPGTIAAADTILSAFNKAGAVIGTEGLATFAQSTADPDAYDVSFDKSRSGGVITVGDCLGVMRFRGHSGAGGLVVSAQIRADSTGTIATTRVASSLIFSTATDAAPSVLTTALTIDNAQRVGIGNTAAQATLHIGNSTSTGKGIRLQNGGGASRSTYAEYIGTNASSVSATWYLGVNVFTTDASFEIKNTSAMGIIIGPTGLVGLGPSATPSANLDVNNGTTATKAYFYDTVTAAASPTDYSRFAIITAASGTAYTLRTEAGGTGLTAGQPRTLQVGTGPSTGTNIAGANAIWHAGQGTGSGDGGIHIFQSSVPGSSGIGVNALASIAALYSNGTFALLGSVGSLFLGTSGEISWTSSSRIKNSSDGVIQLTNAAASSFDRLQFGGTTTSFPALKRSSAELQVVLANDGGFADLQMNRGIFNAPARLKGYTVATLPGSPTQGDIAFVTDALTPTFLTLAVGGGAVVSTVLYNGTQWVTV